MNIRFRGRDIRVGRKLKLVHKKINDLRAIGGLENCVNLTKLILRNNNISKIRNLGTLRNLRELDLSNNNITKLEGLESLINLQYLNLTDNPIEPFLIANFGSAWFHPGSYGSWGVPGSTADCAVRYCQTGEITRNEVGLKKGMQAQKVIKIIQGAQTVMNEAPEIASQIKDITENGATFENVGELIKTGANAISKTTGKGEKFANIFNEVVDISQEISNIAEEGLTFQGALEIMDSGLDIYSEITETDDDSLDYQFNMRKRILSEEKKNLQLDGSLKHLEMSIDNDFDYHKLTEANSTSKPLKKEQSKKEIAKSDIQTSKGNKIANVDLLASKLKKLKKLLDLGAITEEEFNVKKKKYLEKI